LEPGCATGILTALLAPRAERYLATDRHERAVEVTRQRVEALPHVAVRQGTIPDDWPDATFDLVVLSEVLYYLDAAGVSACLDRAAASTVGDAELVAVHFREPVVEHTLSGDAVHDLIAGHPAWRREVEHREARFLLEVFRRR